MLTRLKVPHICCLLMLLNHSVALADAEAQNKALIMQHLQALTQHESMGARQAGSEKEKNTAAYITQALQNMGYRVEQQAFSYEYEGETYDSLNIIADLAGHQDDVVILGAHYDSTAEELGSLGAIDNGSGIASMLVIAKNIARLKPDYSVRFIAFGAEEVGLQGSYYYVKSLSSLQQQKIKAMINFDTIAGGDQLYIHSADTQAYECDKGQYSSSPVFRDALLKLSDKTFAHGEGYQLHPQNAVFSQGVTGSWSDHAPFACIGAPVAYLEATNFDIDGQDGKDGYSQTTHADTWSCFDKQSLSSCDRKTEKHWGHIWHTQHDRLDKMEQMFPGRLSSQINKSVVLVTQFFTEMKSHLK